MMGAMIAAAGVALVATLAAAGQIGKANPDPETWETLDTEPEPENPMLGLVPLYPEGRADALA